MAAITLSNPLNPWDDRDDLDFKAITLYIEEQRPLISKYPGLLDKIQEFEQWKSQLGWYETTINRASTLGQAATFRNEIRQIIGDTIDPSWVPADAATMIMPEPVQYQSPIPWIKIGVGALAVVGVWLGYIAIKKSPVVAAVRAALPKPKPKEENTNGTSNE
jgi:hypothetical protein